MRYGVSTFTLGAFLQDLTKGSIAGHVGRFASFIFVTMLFQTLYFLVDLYFVGRLGTSAVAGVAIAGNAMFVVLALTQALGVGTTTLVSQAVGARNISRAEHAVTQSQILALVVGAVFGIIAFATRHSFAAAFAADPGTAAMSVAYLEWYIPALVLQFALVTMASALRGAGDVRVASLVQMATVALNVVLAPVLIAGWGTGWPLGVAGAGLATFLAVVAGALMLLGAFVRPGARLRFRVREVAPDLAIWRRLVAIGAPAGGEFLAMGVLFTAIQAILAALGSTAQAGFGIGMRVMQAVFLPGMAVSFALAPIAGQNVGARLPDRIRETFRVGVLGACGVMGLVTALVQLMAERMVAAFSMDPNVIAVGVEYLRVVSWTFVANGVIFACSAMFQAFGNTVPSLIASWLRVGLYVLAAQALSRRTGFTPRTLWIMSVVSVLLQMALVLALLRREGARRLSEMRSAPISRDRAETAAGVPCLTGDP
jgi:putative MATE family efflux protein